MADLRWTVVVPVKRLSSAKTRLPDDPRLDRSALALAFARDVVRAAAASALVAEVVVVTDDAAASAALGRLGARVVPDAPAAGLNRALEHGVAAARARTPDTAVAALASDLPALRTDELDRALEAAASRRRTFVSDAADLGTTLLTARPGVGLAPAFGWGSAAEHLASGAIPCDLPDIPGLRLDVDTAADLEAAVALGVGPATAAVLEGAGAA